MTIKAAQNLVPTLPGKIDGMVAEAGYEPDFSAFGIYTTYNSDAWNLAKRFCATPRLDNPHSSGAMFQHYNVDIPALINVHFWFLI